MKKRFKRVYIEITNNCNLICSFCLGTSRPRQFMSEELFRHILVSLKGYTDYLYFHVMGEPLLHPRIGDFLAISAEYDYQVNITTNGILLDKVAAKLLNQPALRQVNISLHSQESQTDIDFYLEKVFAFIRQANCYISLRLWNLASDSNNEYLLQRIVQEFGLPFNIIETIKPGIGIKIRDKVFINPERQFKWPSLQATEIPGRAFCYGLKNQIAILVDGTVVPCCLDGEGIIDLGNINEQDLAEILSSQRVSRIVEGFSQARAVEKLCKKCGYRTRFTT